MAFRLRRGGRRWRVLLVLAICAILLPPATHAATLRPSLPDYSATLQAIAPSLQRDASGALHFPYPQVDQTAEPALPPDQPTTRRLFLPLVVRAGGTAAPLSLPLGDKPVLQTLLPDPQLLVSDLGFAGSQVQQVQAVLASEQAGIAALQAQAAAIIDDQRTSLADQRAAIAAIDYNGQLRELLEGSLRQLRTQLGDHAYAQLTAWLDRQWQDQLNQRRAARAAAWPAPGAAGRAAQDPCPTFTVYATRSTYTDRSADLPDQYIALANRGIEYAHGYTSTTVYSINLQLDTTILNSVVITDVAPHNHDDNYWNTITDTLHPRRLFGDLPWGMPEAEAAYFDDYNDGLNQFGQIVTNPAGVNLSQSVAEQLGMAGSAWVDLTFPWDCLPAPAPPPRIERSWGANDWSQSEAHLVNPVTGNQSLWTRDLYVPAPGLPIDIVRSYNSRDGSDGIFGRGWSSEFDMRVYAQPDGSYKVRYADGQRGLFRPDGAGGFVGEPGIFDSFTADGAAYVLTLADEQISYRFAASGRLQSISDMVGNQATLAYTAGNPTAITDSSGRRFTLTFDGNGHVTRIEDPAGHAVTYRYAPPTSAPLVLGLAAAPLQESAALTSVTDPNQGTTTYEYDPASQAMNRAVDADGIAFVENLYDQQGRVRAQRNAKNEQGSFAYDAQNRRATVTDKLGNRTIYVYDKQMRIIREIDALGNSVAFTYNDQDRMVAKQDKRGHTWKFAYDQRGNTTRREEPVATDGPAPYHTDVTVWVYNARNQVTRMTDGLGNVTRYEYDARGNLARVIEPDGATTSSVFNGKGQMTRVTDAKGTTTRYEYDARGNRSAIIDAQGGTTRLRYDDAGRVLSRTDAENHTTRYEYDRNGNITKTTDPLGGITRSEYNRNNLVTKEIDRRGGTTTFTYDKELNLVEETDPLGHKVRYAYDAMHNRTKIIDANDNITTYRYDKLYRITSITDPLGATTSYRYDANDNVVSTTDALDQTTRYTYDALDRRTVVTDALGNHTELGYDQLDRVTRTVDARGNVSRYLYDSVGNLIRIVNPLGAVTTYDYDRIHNRTRTTDPNGHTRTITYDSLSRETARTDALGHTVRIGYDKLGNITRQTDANGGVSRMAYNANSWMTRMTDALGAQMRYTYDQEGNQLSVTDANGHTSRSVYDLRGDPTTRTDPAGKTTRFSYDPNGNLLSQTDPNGNQTHYEYGASDLLARVVDALQHPSLYEYDLLGRLIRTTDANGRANTYSYDALDHLTAAADAKGQVMRYRYDAAGNLTQLTDAKQITTRFVYNALNQVIQETNALGKTWRSSYDAAGNMVAKIDARNQAIRYEYDPTDRLIRKSFPDGKSVTYDYDRNGNQVRMTDWNGTFAVAYDAVNQQVAATDHKGRRLAYSYDALGNRVSVIYPNGRVVRYHYDQRNQLTAMYDPDDRAMIYAYDAASRLTSHVRPNNTRTDFSYDSADQLTSTHTSGPGGAVIGNFDYTLDRVGARTRVVATRPGEAPVTYNYGYDEIYQLVSASSSTGQALSYRYDALGNRLSLQGTPEPIPPAPPTAPISTTYQYDQISSMLRAGNTALRYDANGNRVRSEQPLTETKYAELGLHGTLITNYTFDAEDRLVEARETIQYSYGSGGSTRPTRRAVVMEADYSYDGNGRRIAKLVQTYNLAGSRLDLLLREYVYDGLDVASEYDYHNGAARPDTTNYYYANGEKVTLERTSATGSRQLYWYAYDAQGSTTALLDAAGQVAAAYQNDEFGQLLTGNSQLNHFLFTGQEYDPETSLYHFFARYYDPATGVWLSQDPQPGSAMRPGSWHRYAYVLNNPLNMVDRLGLWPDWLDDAVDKAGDLANDYIVQPAKKAVETVKEAAKDAADVLDRYVVKPVVKTATKVKDEVGRRYEQVKDRVVQTARDINDRYIKPAREKAAAAIKAAREGITKAADWVQKHKDDVAMIAGTVGAIAAGAAFCGVTAGIGCAVIAGVAGGALAAGGVQMGANMLDSSADTSLFDNVGRAALVGGATGGLDALTGGIAGRAWSAAKPALQRGATAVMGRAATYAPRAVAATRAATRGAGAAMRRSATGLRNLVGRGCANSFSADTPVLTERGTQPVSRVKVGDRVLAYHQVLGTTAAYTVTATVSHVDTFVEQLTIDGERLETTQDHPFYTLERGWVAAGQLWLGAQVYRANGQTGMVEDVTVVRRQQRMFNLTVAQAHSFFVGIGRWLVHNCGPQLPAFTGGKTRGMLDIGTERIPLVSGEVGPAARMPATTPGMTTRLDVRTHVEAHAAAIMRQRGLQQATLYINNARCTGPKSCTVMLEHMLPEGAMLRIRVLQRPDVWKGDFEVGLPDSAWRP